MIVFSLLVESMVNSIRDTFPKRGLFFKLDNDYVLYNLEDYIKKHDKPAGY